MTIENATIYALSSAPGKAGVSVVRVSGPAAWDSLQSLTQTTDGTRNGDGFIPRQSSLRAVRVPETGEIIDQALVLPFKAPASFTGDDVVEYHLHGSIAVVEAVLAALSHQPHHRLAEPGEFTRRAFENGKLDLTEAEAVADLINAETQAQRQQALLQMGGALSQLYNGWREELVKALAYVEAVIDFPDEDVPDSETAKAHPAIEKIVKAIDLHLRDNRRGEILRNGVQMAIIGAPNAGKSSLINVLANRDVAIVSPMAGTTRDIIEAHLDLGGYPVIVADTAGLRPDQITEDGQHGSVESEGIRRAIARAENADIRLLIFDVTQGAPDPHSCALIDEKSIIVLNKCDQANQQQIIAFTKALETFIQGRSKASRSDGEDESYQESVENTSLPLLPSIVVLSVETGEGLEQLLDTLSRHVAKAFAISRETPSLTRARHRTALEECLSSLRSALQAPLPELMAEDLRIASRALGRITGRVDVEDLLDVIFRDFCIGK